MGTLVKWSKIELGKLLVTKKMVGGRAQFCVAKNEKLYKSTKIQISKLQWNTMIKFNLDEISFLYASFHTIDPQLTS